MDTYTANPASPEENPEYRAARRRARRMRKFYEHLVTYVATCAGLLLFNYLTSPNGWWVQWVIFPWGIGMVSHWLSVFGFHGHMGADWEERKVRELMEKNRAA